MLRFTSASFKLKLLLSVILLITASLLTSSFTTYTFTTRYQLKTQPIFQNSENYLPEEESVRLSAHDVASPPKDSTLPSAIANIQLDYPGAPEPEPEPMGFPYFGQPGDGDILVHYDARFFLGQPVSPADRRSTLHHMIRAYLTTMRHHNLETWIAHGTLLGWWWNGHSLPWDWDLDVQVSESTLYHMGSHMNMSTFNYEEVADPSQGVNVSTTNNGHRIYLLDVNEHIYEREKGIGDNFIDARWIDTSNGLFIDITGISITDPDGTGESGKGGADRWQCKNEHWYNGSEIWPLRETVFEGVQTSVPYDFELVLKEEYGEVALRETRYNGYKWNGELGEWVELSDEEKVAVEKQEEDRRQKEKIEEELMTSEDEGARKLGKASDGKLAQGIEAVQQAQEAGLLGDDEEVVGVEIFEEIVEHRKSWIHFLMGLS